MSTEHSSNGSDGFSRGAWAWLPLCSRQRAVEAVSRADERASRYRLENTKTEQEGLYWRSRAEKALARLTQNSSGKVVEPIMADPLDGTDLLRGASNPLRGLAMTQVGDSDA